MNTTLNFENILFLDIETVPEVENFSELSDEKQELFAQKTAYQRKEEVTSEDFYERAGIWAEFGKIVCISVGYFVNFKSTNRTFRVTSFFGDDETVILNGFKKLLESHFNKPDHVLCAHNGKEFDFPYIARRMIINQIALPDKLNLFGKKPWEIAHLDTLEMWKFGDYKHYTSLNLLAQIFNIPSPKDDIDGSQVAEVYYKQNDLARIAQYCEKDALTVAQLFLRYKNDTIINQENFERVLD